MGTLITGVETDIAMCGRVSVHYARNRCRKWDRAGTARARKTRIGDEGMADGGERICNQERAMSSKWTVFACFSPLSGFTAL